jgi:hypothetical protein
MLLVTFTLQKITFQGKPLPLPFASGVKGNYLTLLRPSVTLYLCQELQCYCRYVEYRCYYQCDGTGEQYHYGMFC